MRLLMLNNEFPPLGGGTGTVHKALLDRLALESTIDVDVVTSALQNAREEIQFADRIRIVRVPVNNHDIHHSSNRELATYAARAYVEVVRLHRERPYDLCFAWSTVPAGAVALALRRRLGLRYLIRVSGPDIPGFERRYAWLYPILTPLIRRTWTRAECVVAKCESEAAMIQAVAPAVKATIVPNGVDLRVFESGPRCTEGPLRLLCVGRLIERKGHRHLLDALATLTRSGVDASLELVGTGDERRRLENLVAALGLRDRVVFAGYVPREEIPRRYAAADVFVLPSYNEGMSVATLEAMAAGLPIVVTRTGGSAELVEDGVNGLTFDWGDTHTLSQHLARFAADRHMGHRMGAASRARAASFSWDAMTRRFLELFRLVLSPNLSGPAV